MPIFDFKCIDCDVIIKDEFVAAKEFEKNQEPIRECPKCKKKMIRKPGSPMFYFRRKGSN